MFLKTYVNALAIRSPSFNSCFKILKTNQERNTSCIKEYFYFKIYNYLNQTLLKLGNRGF